MSAPQFQTPITVQETTKTAFEFYSQKSLNLVLLSQFVTPVLFAESFIPWTFFSINAFPLDVKAAHEDLVLVCSF